MSALTPDQFYALARSKGATTAEAIKLAGAAATESQFGARPVQPGGKGRGLFQIDMGQHPEIPEAQALDDSFAMQWAITALRANKGKLNRQEGGPHDVWYGPKDNPDGAAKGRAAVARVAGTGETGGPSGWEKTLLGLVPGSSTVYGAVSKPVDTLTSVADVVTQLGRAVAWITSAHNVVRLLEGLVGIVGIFVGVIMLDDGLSGGAALAKVTGTAKTAAKLAVVA